MVSYPWTLGKRAFILLILIFPDFMDQSRLIPIDRRKEVSRIRLGEEWWVQPTDELLGRLAKLVGEGCVGVAY